MQINPNYPVIVEGWPGAHHQEAPAKVTVHAPIPIFINEVHFSKKQVEMIESLRSDMKIYGGAR
ncbi:MAG TPA: hypothetical protein VFV77_01620 [Gammaproteobacteria bacterium]|nr:hypothetical protein [Gammaproteobacteria bacterium]